MKSAFSLVDHDQTQLPRHAYPLLSGKLRQRRPPAGAHFQWLAFPAVVSSRPWVEMTSPVKMRLLFWAATKWGRCLLATHLRTSNSRRKRAPPAAWLAYISSLLAHRRPLARSVARRITSSRTADRLARRHAGGDTLCVHSKRAVPLAGPGRGRAASLSLLAARPMPSTEAKASPGASHRHRLDRAAPGPCTVIAKTKLPTAVSLAGAAQITSDTCGPLCRSGITRGSASCCTVTTRTGTARHAPRARCACREAPARGFTLHHVRRARSC